MKIGMISLGCVKNLVDSQNIMSSLSASGHTFVSDPSEADVIVINTCGFIAPAKKESIDTILGMAEYKNYNLKYLVVTGCLVERYYDDLVRELPEVDLFIPVREYKQLDAILDDFLKSEKVKDKQIMLATSPYMAYLRIGDGCSNCCTFCAIPLIRGRYHSFPFEDLIAEAKKLEALGVKELNVIAQDTTKYGIDLYNKLRLHELLRELNKMNFHWIRVLYMYPDEIYDELLDTIKECEKVVPYFDIPSQHGSNRVLKAMNRRGTKEDIIRVTTKVREMFDDPTIRTTVIVGFPSETEEEFEELYQLTNQIRWDRFGAFAYSLEENTPAFNIEPKVDEEVAQARMQKLMLMQEKIAQENNEAHIGKTIEVLVEGRDGINETKYFGRGKMHAPDGVDGQVIFTCDKPLNAGDFIDVEITAASGYDLKGIAK